MNPNFSFNFGFEGGGEGSVFGSGNIDLHGTFNSPKVCYGGEIYNEVDEGLRETRIAVDNETRNDYEKSSGFGKNVAFEVPEGVKKSGVEDHLDIVNNCSSNGNSEKNVEDELSNRLSSVLEGQGTGSGMQLQAGDSVNGVSSIETSEKTMEFSFASKRDSVSTPVMEFKTPGAKGNLFSGLNLKSGFGAKAEALRDLKARRKGKLKQPIKIQLSIGQDFISKEKIYGQTTESSEASISMDVPAKQGFEACKESPGETSRLSDESVDLNIDNALTDSYSAVSNDSRDGKPVILTQELGINEQHLKPGFKNEDYPGGSYNKGVMSDDALEDSVSDGETENQESGFVSSAETGNSSAICSQKQDSPAVTGSNFTFSASSPAVQGPLSASKRQIKKKNSFKFGYDPYSSPSSTSIPIVPSSPSQSSVFSEVQSFFCAGQTHKLDSVAILSKVENESVSEKGQEYEKEFNFKSDKAEEACEQWRLRGNNAYARGDLPRAEECYTRGINAAFGNERSKNCLRTLMLSYSNRAAARMSLGRMREALRDCMMAISMDPDFLRVQVRAANCYLALGEVEHASQYFKKCLRSGSDVCVDKKLLAEASDGSWKVEKVSESISQSAELLTRRTSSDAEKALEMISEALLISPHSEKLVEMKAKVLFMLRRYEEVIKLCEQTFDTAEKNSPPRETDEQLVDPGGPQLPSESSFRIWRCCFILKSYFQLGKLEEAITSLEKQAALSSVTNRNGGETLESSIPLAATVRELLHLKTAGNKAFQSGRHMEAVEHYTAALSFNVESRRFTAVCFCNRAAAYRALGQIIDSIADCSLAMALDRNYAKAISRRAILFEMIGDYGQAADDLRRLIALLTKKMEERINLSGDYDISKDLMNDLKQARLKLCEIQANARKGTLLDMYLILGVESTASGSEIRKAYRKAALRYHPDKAGQSLSRNDHADDEILKEIGEDFHKDADKLFKMIGEAYAILSDPAKRSTYDVEYEAKKAETKHNGSSTPREYSDSAQDNLSERSGSRQHFREAQSSSHDPSASKGAQVTRSNR